MIQKLEINGVHLEVDEKLQKYVSKKLGGLDSFMPRRQRDGLHLTVELKKAAKSKDQLKYTCAALLHLPKTELSVSESTVNIFAAVDIVEAKLKQQIKKYKDQHQGGKLARHLAGRWRRRTAIV